MGLEQYLSFGKPNFSDEEISAVTRVLRSGWIGMGPETLAFEKELARYLEAPHVVTVNSCTSALFLSLLVLGIGPGDEVICPSLTWCSTANVASYLGARPVFADVGPDTLCLTPETVRPKLTTRTKAVIVVHYGGLAAEVKALQETLPPGVALVEDAAHALGARFADGRPVGSSGNLTCFSFYANKNLSTAEGGAVALFDETLADQLRSLRQHGMPADAWARFSSPQKILSCEFTYLGYKMNYTDLQASIGRVQLRRQTEFGARRLEIAKRYYNGFMENNISIEFQSHILHPYHARHLFVVQLPLDQMHLSRDECVLSLRAQNIGASIHYPPLHKMPLYASLNSGSLPITEHVCKRILTLPISASMKDDDASQVITTLKSLLN
jgi:UDP-4-amino-4-deoxy-L-arabinose-oxoglutarate aminotransferase